LQIFYGKLILNSPALLLNPFMHLPFLQGIVADENILPQEAMTEFLALTKDIFGSYTSPLYRLSTTNAGKDVILFLIRDPLMRQALKNQAFLERKYTDRNDDALDAGDCIYNNLYYSKSGRRVLKDLDLPIGPLATQNEAKAKPNFDIDVLKPLVEKRMAEEAPRLPIRDIFRYCAFSVEGFAIDYIEFVLTNPPTCKLFSLATSALDHTQGLNLFHSLIDLILPNGQSCLTMLCKHCPEFILKCCVADSSDFINAERLYFILNIFFSNYQDEMPINFFWLAQLPVFRTGILSILKQEQNYQKLISIDKIMEQAKAVSDPFGILKMHLEQDESGKELMQLIGLDKYPAPAASSAVVTTSSETQLWSNLFTQPSEPEPEKTPDKLTASGELHL
jgi:hypothetical protein